MKLYEIRNMLNVSHTTIPVQVILAALGLLYGFAVLQALLIAFYLFFQKKGIASCRSMLGLLMLNFAVFLTGTFLLLVFPHWRHIYYAHLLGLTVFLAPPLLYFYFKSLVDEKFLLTYRALIHAVPFLSIFCTMFCVVIVLANRDFVFRPYGIVLVSGLFLQNLFYLHKIMSERRNIPVKKHLSQKLKWVEYLWGGVFLIFAFKLLLFITWNVLGLVDLCIYLTGVFFIFSFLMINVLVLYSLFNPETLINYFKYQSSSINESLKSKYYDELLLLLEQKKLYLDPLLNLDKLARPLNISGKQLSQLINEHTENNFNDFINQYRIAEAQKLIQNNHESRMNILDIAYDVGFNSKSPFNNAFRKFTGNTPSGFRKRFL